MLKLYGAKKAVGRMAALDVVVAVDKGLELTIGLAARVEDHAVDELLLDGGEEALGNGVVEAVALAAHAGNEAMVMENLPIALADILRATIRVVDQSSFWFARYDRHLQGLDG